MNVPKQCEFCPNSKTDYYTCPKCNANYCSLKCYRAPAHLQCTETFYKQCVEEEMRLVSKAGLDVKKKTVEALKTNLADDEAEGLDSDDETDLSDRLAGVDLEDSDQVWQNLTESERAEFRNLVETGDISKFVPEFRPWWDHHFTPARKVQDLEESQREVHEFTDQINERIPQPLSKISSLREITGVGGGSPVSPTVKFGLMNVMYAYAFTHRLYRGSVAEDPDNLAEFPGVVLTICGSLRTPRPQNFDSAEMALQAAVTSVVENGALLQTSDEEAKKIRNDVFKIVRGPGLEGLDNLYLLSALSDLIRLMKQAARHSKSKEVKLAIKKLQFYLSWANDSYQDLKA